MAINKFKSFDEFRGNAQYYLENLNSIILDKSIRTYTVIMRCLNKYCICETIERYHSSKEDLMNPQKLYVDTELRENVSKLVTISKHTTLTEFIEIINQIEDTNNKLSEIIS